MAESGGDADRERFEQPEPGSAGSESEQPSSLPEEPEVDTGDDEDSQAEDESKQSHPTSDPPGNY